MDGSSWGGSADESGPSIVGVDTHYDTKSHKSNNIVKESKKKSKSQSTKSRNARAKKKQSKYENRPNESHIVFSVDRLKEYMKEQEMLKVNRPAAQWMAAVLEYMVAEICEVAGNECNERHDKMSQKRKKLILPRDIHTAVKKDEELNELLKDVIIPGTNFIPTPVPDPITKNKDPKTQN